MITSLPPGYMDEDKKQNTNRLFLAIPLPQAIREELAAKLEVFKGHKGIGVTKTDNLHVTVYFYGNVEDSAIPGLITSIRQNLQGVHPFELQMSRLVLFPPRRSRMVWATFERSEEFIRLADRFQPPATGGSRPAGQKEQIPHITCVRLKHFGKLGIPLPGIQPWTISVGHLELWKSTPGDHGVQYHSIAQFPLI